MPFALALLIAAQGPTAGQAPQWLIDARAQFISACADGNLQTTAPMQEIQRADLPGNVRRRYRDDYTGHFYRLGTDHPNYLIQVATSNARRQFDQICALAVPGRNSMMLTLFGNVTDPVIRARRADPADHRDTVTQTDAGGFIVLEISHFAPGADPSRWHGPN
jgi:hypothetical protein